MCRYQIILLLLISLCINLVCCNNTSNKNQTTSDPINLSNEKKDTTSEDVINTTNNYIINKHELNIGDNSKHITDLAARNNAIVAEYINSIDYIKNFCIIN